jgi:thiamine-phosphate pyrophosphorylase
MMMALPWPPLMVITNRHMTPDLAATIGAALKGGARWVLLREKDMAPPARLDLARRLKAEAERHSALLGINSDMAAARTLGMPLLHLPITELHQMAQANGFLVGASVHDMDEAERATAAGANYLLLAPIFATESKRPHRPPIGLANLHAIAAAVRIPVIALGGMSPPRAADCLRAGAAGIAVMGAIMRAADPAMVTAAFLKEMEP